MKKFLTVCATIFLTFGLGLMLTACGGSFSDAFTSYAKSSGVSTKFQTMSYSETGTSRSVTAQFTYAKNTLGKLDIEKPQFFIQVLQGGKKTEWYLTDGTIYYSNSATNEKFFLPYYKDEWQDLWEFVSISDDAFDYVLDAFNAIGKMGEHSISRTEENGDVSFEANGKNLISLQELKVDFVGKQIRKVSNTISHSQKGETNVEISSFDGTLQFPNFDGYADGSILDTEKFYGYISTLGQNFTTKGFDFYKKNINAQTNGKIKIDGLSKDVYLSTTGGEKQYGASNEKIWLESNNLYYQFDEEMSQNNQIWAEYDQIVLDKDNKSQPIKRAKEAVEGALQFYDSDLKAYFDKLFAAVAEDDRKIKRQREDDEVSFVVEVSQFSDYLKVVFTLKNNQLVKFETYNTSELILSIKPLSENFPYLSDHSSFIHVSGN